MMRHGRRLGYDGDTVLHVLMRQGHRLGMMGMRQGRRLGMMGIPYCLLPEGSCLRVKTCTGPRQCMYKICSCEFTANNNSGNSWYDDGDVLPCFDDAAGPYVVLPLV